MDWKYGLSSRAPALQALSPEFKLQFQKKKKKITVVLMVFKLD
jgi:hypothetical protein